jgi:hypothetical protein
MILMHSSIMLYPRGTIGYYTNCLAAKGWYVSCTEALLLRHFGALLGEKAIPAQVQRNWISKGERSNQR